MFGLTFEKLFFLLIIVGLFLGPSRLPVAALWLGRTVRHVRAFARSTSRQLEAEIGEPIDWQKLDPRQYDPRRIIREALAEGAPAGDAPTPSGVPAVAAPTVVGDAVSTDAKSDM